MKKPFAVVILAVAMLLPQSAFAWNNTGHKLVASIAWDNLSEPARNEIISLLLKAPADACLRNLFQANGPNENERKRQFFILAATWPDIIRPHDENDHRKCTSLHRSTWHFVDHFWSGFSGSSTQPPTDVNKPIAQINAVERLTQFRPFVASDNTASDRAIDLAWILHLVGDIHQPLHTSARVTTSEPNGDGGGNSFKLDNQPKGLTLHKYWDGIVDRAQPKKTNESDVAYIKRLTTKFETDFPKSHFTELQPGKSDRWAAEALNQAKSKAYPQSLIRKQLPKPAYQTSTFGVAEESIAAAGYRLADLLETLFGGGN
jgi:hypothetical protein